MAPGTSRRSGLAPKPAWTPDRVSEARREMLMRAIVVVEMTVETIAGNFKLNQHKSDADHVAVASVLARHGDPSAQAIARRVSGRSGPAPERIAELASRLAGAGR